MDDSTITNQDPPKTLSSLEKELEAIKNQAIKEYRGKQTQSPIRTSAENVVFSKTEENKELTEKRPTYLEQTQLGKTPSLETTAVQPKPGSSRMVFWVGIGLLALAVILAGAYFLYQAN